MEKRLQEKHLVHDVDDNIIVAIDCAVTEKQASIEEVQWFVVVGSHNDDDTKADKSLKRHDHALVFSGFHINLCLRSLI